MGFPKAIPYKEFLELREEVFELHCTLKLVLRILGGLAGFEDQELAWELGKELTNKGTGANINLLFPKTKTEVTDCVDITDEDCEIVDNVSGNGVKTPMQLTKKSAISNKRKINDNKKNFMNSKKALILLKDSSTLLPNTKTQSLSFECSTMSEIDSQFIEKNNLLNTLKSNKVTIDVETVAADETLKSPIKSNPEKKTVSKDQSNKTNCSFSNAAQMKLPNKTCLRSTKSSSTEKKALTPKINSVTVKSSTITTPARTLRTSIKPIPPKIHAAINKTLAKTPYKVYPKECLQKKRTNEMSNHKGIKEEQEYAIGEVLSCENNDEWIITDVRSQFKSDEPEFMGFGPSLPSEKSTIVGNVEKKIINKINKQTQQLQCKNEMFLHQ